MSAAHPCGGDSGADCISETHLSQFSSVGGGPAETDDDDEVGLIDLLDDDSEVDVVEQAASGNDKRKVIVSGAYASINRVLGSVCILSNVRDSWLTAN